MKGELIQGKIVELKGGMKSMRMGQEGDIVNELRGRVSTYYSEDSICSLISRCYSSTKEHLVEVVTHMLLPLEELDIM